MILILNFFILSLIIYFLLIRVGKNFSLFSLIPILYFIYINRHDIKIIEIALLIILIGFPIYNLFIKKVEGFSTVGVQLAVPWFIFLGKYISDITELIIFIVSLKLVKSAIGNEKIINSNKTMRYDTNIIALTLLVGFLVSLLVFFGQGNLNLNLDNTITSSFKFVISGLILMLFLIQLNAFGAYSIIKTRIKNMNKSNTNFYHFLNLVLIPSLFLPQFKKIIDSDLLSNQIYLVSFLLLGIIVSALFELNRRKYFIGSYLIPNLNMTILSVFTLFNPASGKLFFIEFLILNYLIFICFDSNWFKKIKHYYNAILMLPAIYLLILPNNFYELVIREMNISSNIIFSSFLFFPLIFINSYRTKE